MSTRQLIRDNFSEQEVAQLDLSVTADSSVSCYQQLVQLLDAAELDGPDDAAFRKVLAKATSRYRIFFKILVSFECTNNIKEGICLN